MKVALLVAVALIALLLLRRQSAALRHWVLALGIVCAALTPAVVVIVPEWHVPIGRGFSVAPVEPLPALAVSAREQFSIPSQQGSTHPPSPARTIDTWRAIWIAGTALSLLILSIGLARLGWLASRASRVRHDKWSRLLGPVVLLQSDHPTLLVTWGFAHPKIILPSAARQWSDDRMRIVLTHELAHIHRGDWLVQMIAELLRSAYWFNPLLWIACRRLRLESEHACDDAVLNQGIEGSDYATELVRLARDLKQRRTLLAGVAGFPAPAMARPSSLERRVTAMSNAGINRAPLTTRLRLGIALVLVCVTVPIASAQSAFATFSGSVVDAQGLPLPGAAMVLTNEQRESKYEVKSDSAGHFEFVGLPAGVYLLDAVLSGFASPHESVSIAAAQNLQRQLTLKVGSLKESITVTVDDANPPQARTAAQSRPFQPEDLSRCAGAAPVGGNIKAPRKIKDMRPQYPESLRGSGTDGFVVLEGTIGLDGFLKNIEVYDGANPDLASAAVAAVREWQYTQTLLNCTPIEVQVTVSTRFRRRQ
jgi:beta-lactamase regulating signal transducer with metallopeptidase domain